MKHCEDRQAYYDMPELDEPSLALMVAESAQPSDNTSVVDVAGEMGELVGSRPLWPGITASEPDKTNGVEENIGTEPNATNGVTAEAPDITVGGAGGAPKGQKPGPLLDPAAGVADGGFAV